MSSSAVPAKLGRQPTLDGIRGLAILAVLAAHFDWPWLPGGFLGVDIFFALSGFLITTLLLDEQFESGGISLRYFFARRAIRLYPALVALVIVSTAFSLLFHHEISMRQDLWNAVGVLTYEVNWQDLADPNGWHGGMPHTWSLAIEVQFYIVWAVTIAFLSRRFGVVQERSKLLNILTAIAIIVVIASAGWRAVLWVQQTRWLRMYLGTDTRLDAVFIGALAALIRLRFLAAPEKVRWLTSTGRIAISILESICALVLAVLLVTLHWEKALPGMIAFALAGGVTAVLILTTTLRADSLFGWVLGAPVLRWFGRISYSLYLWHVPVEKFATSQSLIALGLPPLVAEGVRLAVAIISGVISYHLIEQTFLRLKRRFEPSLSQAEANGPTALLEHEVRPDTAV